MLWDKKIQLGKEVKEALNPNVGSTEISDMESEIHRMKLRLASIKKLQEKMVLEMEKSLERREASGSKVRVAGLGSETLKKKICILSGNIRKAVNDIKEIDNDIESLKSSNESMTIQIEETRVGIEEISRKELEFQLENEIITTRKRMASNATIVLQKVLNRYRDVKDKKYSLLQPLSISRDEALGIANERIAKISTAIELLIQESSEKTKLILNEYLKVIECTREDLGSI